MTSSNKNYGYTLCNCEEWWIIKPGERCASCFVGYKTMNNPKGPRLSTLHSYYQVEKKEPDVVETD
jgi:hypothetical protein